MGISSTIFAASDDEMRPIMSGILFEISTEDLKFVATDGFKLVRVKTTNSKGAENSSFVLPKKPISLLKAILPKEQGDVQIKFDKKNVYFELSNYRMICRLIEGDYPAYNMVIPKDNPNKVTIDRSSFLNALRRISVYASQSTNLVKMEMADGQIVCSAQDFDFSISATESLACSYEGEPMTIGFKCSILVEMLNNLSSDNVLLELSHPTRAGLLSPLEQSETEDVLMLLSPMQIPD
jgi:DNA polymerase-3 subunit beta